MFNLNFNTMKNLSIEKMEQIEGGVSREEYCNTLCMILCNNEINQAMADAWNTNCGPYGYPCHC